MTVFLPIPCCIDYCRFVVSFGIGTCESSGSGLFQDDFGYLGSLESPREFEDGFFNECKKDHWDFDRDCTEGSKF